LLQTIKRHMPFFIWAPGAALLVYIASVDLYLSEQLIVAVMCVLVMAVGWWRYIRTLHNHYMLRTVRLFVMVVAGFLAIRYIIWRFEYSIPWFEDTFSIFCSLLLLGAECIAVALYFGGAFVNLHPLRRHPDPLDMKDPNLPTVDVFIPTYNEDADLLRTTLLAATDMIYPRDKLRVYLLDDGGTQAKCEQRGKKGEQACLRRKELQDLCFEVGCFYLTRKDNQDAKAGNINAALERTDGELVVIFDADHIPTADFLKNTVGTLVADERKAFVQTPHFVINQDPFEKNLKAGQKMPNEAEMFYTMNLRGMDNWGAGFFCGSGAVIRRKALEEIGGIATDTIVEDAETSIELVRRGWKTAYLHLLMLCGLNAESTEAYVHQRQRWATGMCQLLWEKNPLFVRGLNIAQRVSYFNCILFWIFSLSRIVFIVSPLLALLGGVTLFAAPPIEILLYMVPYLIGLGLVVNMLYGRVRWLFVSEIYETLSAMFLFKNIIKTILIPKHEPFIVTPKGERMEYDKLSYLAPRFYVVIALQFIAIGAGYYQLSTDPTTLNTVTFSMGWNLYNMIFTLAALGVLIERRQVRARPRVPIHEMAKVKFNDKFVPCEIIDMTEDGAMLRLPGWMESLEVKDGSLEFAQNHIAKDLLSLTRVLENLNRVGFKVTMTRVQKVGKEKHLLVGVKFQYEDEIQRVAVVSFVYGNSERWKKWLMGRNAHSKIRQGMVFVARAAYFGLIHIAMAFKGLHHVILAFRLLSQRKKASKAAQGEKA